jgi:hypothetical protein
VGGNQAIEDGAPLGQIPQRIDLVGSHQAAVSLDIGGENRDQPALCVDWSRQNIPQRPVITYRGTRRREISKMVYRENKVRR